MDYKQILKDFLGVEVAEEVTSPEVVERVVEKIVEVEKPTRIRKAYRPHSDEQMFGMFKDGKLEELKKALEENIRYEAEQSKGTSKSELSCIKKVLDMKSVNPVFKTCHEFTLCGDTWYCFTDGHYALASTQDYGIDHAAEHEKLKNAEKFFEGDFTEEIQVDLADLKTFCKTHKPSKKEKPEPYIITIGEKVIGLNPHFLLNAFEFCEADTILYNKEMLDKADYCYKSPLLVKATKNKAMLLPVNILKKSA